MPASFFASRFPFQFFIYSRLRREELCLKSRQDQLFNIICHMKDKLKDAQTDLLFTAILSLESIEECYAFFADISTIAELKSLAQRFQVAIMLRQGRTYADICETTGVSTATISRVNRSLEYGSDGYQLVLDRLEETGHLAKPVKEERKDI